MKYWHLNESLLNNEFNGKIFNYKKIPRETNLVFHGGLPVLFLLVRIIIQFFK